MSALQCSLGISEKENKPVTIHARTGHVKSSLLCVSLYLRGWLFVCLSACLFVCQCHKRRHASAQEQGPSNAIVCQSYPWSPLVRPQRRPFIEYWISLGLSNPWSFWSNERLLQMKWPPLWQNTCNIPGLSNSRSSTMRLFAFFRTTAINILVVSKLSHSISWVGLDLDLIDKLIVLKMFRWS